MIARLFYGVAGLVLISGACLEAQDTVTIPKSRLEELERKEAELRRLQGATNVVSSRPTLAQPAARAPHPTAPVAAPPLAQPLPTPLPAFKPGDTVEAAKLANAFRSDPTGAEQLFRKKPMAVRGEIVRFHKRMLSRDYTVVLKTADAAVTVACDVTSPGVYEAVFTAKNGSEIVGQVRQSRTTLARVGDRVVAVGRCGKFKNGEVQFIASELRAAP
jgi:hypothetical protein